MKTCSSCKAELPLDAFSRSRARADGLNRECKKCYATYQRAWYANNKKRHYANTRRRSDQVRRDVRAKLKAFLAHHSCIDCGETDPVVLDFDHVKGEKVMAVAHMVTAGRKWSTIEAEIAKCEVRCANCHRRRHAKQRAHTPA